jgi:DNA-binding LytR/AlgR family response regulator
MKTLIVEDEKYARESLAALLHKLEPSVEVVGMFERVKDTVAWLRQNSCDLIFLDIHLADDLSFSIFEQVEIKTPIIFTTAYDHYAIRAFSVNSLAYLLKPIDEEDLRAALNKYHELQVPQLQALLALREAISAPKSPSYQQRFLVKKGETLASVPVEEIAFFEGEDRYVSLIKRDGKRYFVDYKLSDLEEMLNPRDFFRLNRSFIACFDAIAQISVLSKSRVMVGLQPAAKRDIIVSTEKTRELKAWLNR